MANGKFNFSGAYVVFQTGSRVFLVGGVNPLNEKRYPVHHSTTSFIDKDTPV